jgi:excisionase family DNA binding protein
MVESADLTAAAWTGPGPGGTSLLGEGLVTADVVAAHLSIDVSTIYKLAKSGVLPVVVIGRAKRFRVKDVLAFVGAATRGGQQSASVDRVQQLLRGAQRSPCPPRSNDLDASRRQSVHRPSKQERWRAPAGTEETN